MVTIYFSKYNSVHAYSSFFIGKWTVGHGSANLLSRTIHADVEYTIQKSRSNCEIIIKYSLGAIGLWAFFEIEPLEAR